MNKEYIEHEKAFQRAYKLKINDAIEDFKKGATDYFLESPSNESDNYYYNLGKEFGDYLYCTQEDMIIDGKHKSLHGG